MSRDGRNSDSPIRKSVNYKTLGVACAAFALVLILPRPDSVLDVGVEVSTGRTRICEFLSGEIYGRAYGDIEQWQVASIDMLELNIRMGSLNKKGVLRRDLKSMQGLGLKLGQGHFLKAREKIESLDEAGLAGMMGRALHMMRERLSYADLEPAERRAADLAAFHIQVCLAMAVFVIICFLTEAIPLPAVAFCIGLILVFSGVVSRRDVAAMFWSDACWFIMGSLMFAAAFVKTGVDKRICLALFRTLARPSLGWVTAILILVIAPAASFISDHALAAMFLPIALILYHNSLGEKTGGDLELARMLMICIAMACNIGGFGAPSGGARNVIVLTYLEDMFGLTIGYGQWILFGMPFVLIMMPVLWLLINWRFKPKIRDLAPALETLRADIARSGGWTGKQVLAVIIFGVMLFGWITENNVLQSLLGVRLGIGVIAVAGAVIYLVSGVVTWRDYHEKVDWGVVWLYAGAIIFGKVLDSTGAAYWIARSAVEGLAWLGLESRGALLCLGAGVTGFLTNLMADGPAAASVAPVTLNMAALTGQGTTLVPFMGLVTACASSFAYLLVIGTPPNAIVYASGFLRPRDFLRVGIPCFLVACAVLMFLAFVVWPLIGISGLLPM